MAWNREFLSWPRCEKWRKKWWAKGETSYSRLKFAVERPWFFRGPFWFVLRVLGTFPKRKHPTLQCGKNNYMRNVPRLAHELHLYNPTAFSPRIHRCFPKKNVKSAPPSASCQLNELPKALGFIGQTGRNTGFLVGRAIFLSQVWHTKEISCFLDSLRFMKNSWSRMW